MADDDTQTAPAKTSQQIADEAMDMIPDGGIEPYYSSSPDAEPGEPDDTEPVGAPPVDEAEEGEAQDEQEPGDVEAEIKRLEEHYKKQEQQAPPVREEASPPPQPAASPAKAEDLSLDEDDLTFTEAALLKQIKLLKQESAQRDAILSRFDQERRQSEEERFRVEFMNKVGSYKSRFADVFGEGSPLAREANDAVAMGLAQDIREPVELVVLKVVNRFRKAEEQLKANWIEGKLAKRERRTGGRGGSRGGSSAAEPVSPKMEDLYNNKVRDRAHDLLQDVDLSDLR